MDQTVRTNMTTSGAHTEAQEGLASWAGHCPGQTRGLCGAHAPPPTSRRAQIPGRCPVSGMPLSHAPGRPSALKSCASRLPDASPQTSFCKTLSGFSECFQHDGWLATSVSPRLDASRGALKSCEPPGSLLPCCSSHRVRLLLSPEISPHPRAQPQESSCIPALARRPVLASFYDLVTHYLSAPL